MGSFFLGLNGQADLLGFPMDFFPVLFAVPRKTGLLRLTTLMEIGVAGWLAHWKQQLDSGTNKIWYLLLGCELIFQANLLRRPRQLFIGAPYVILQQVDY